LDHAFLGHRVDPRDGHVAGGNWVEWRWDGQALLVTSDAFGAYPLFYAATDDMVAVSASIERVLAAGVSRTLDLDALSGFLAMGYYVDSDTPFRDIRRLPQGGTLAWRPGLIEVSGGPRPFRAHPISRASVVEGIIDGVRAAVGRTISSHLPGGYLMPLSGGRDSRHLLLELVRQGHPPSRCVTARHYPGIGGAEDAPRAAELCSALGIEHETVDLPASIVRAEMRKLPITSYASDEHAWSLAIADRLDGATPQTYDGFPGGTLLQRPWERHPWARLLMEGRVERAAGRLVRPRLGRDRFSELLSPAVRPQLTPRRAAHRMRAALEPHLRDDNPPFAFRFWNRSIHDLALMPTLILSGAGRVLTPYMDADFVTFGSSIPFGSAGRDIHEEAIAKAFPQVAAVPFAAFGGPVMPRTLSRSINRDLARILARVSDGSLIDRGRLLRLATAGALTGDTRLSIGRRPSLITYLVLLERLVRERPRLGS